MIGIGMKVRFVPSFADSVVFTPEERRAAMIDGEVSYINWEHKSFGVEFQCGKSKQTETFEFSQIGQAVYVGGK